MKKIAKVFVGLFIVSVLLSMCSSWADDDDTSEKQATEATQATKDVKKTTEKEKKTEAKKQKATTEEEKLPNLTEQGVAKLIEQLYKGKKLEDIDAKRMQQTGEDIFLRAWEDALYSKIFEDGDDWSKDKSEKFTKMVKVYSDFWGNTAQIDDLISNQKILDQCLSDRESIDTDKYGFDIYGATLNSESFYITQRLGSGYDDTILGAIAKGMEEAKSGPSSNWVAYNVVDGGMHGDEKYILHCNEENPFPKAGIYTISYADTGDTTPVTDSKGFTSNPPLYYVIGDDSTFSEDEAKITELEDKEVTARDAIIMKITGEGEDDQGENDSFAEQAEVKSSSDSDYILEGSDSRYITKDEIENFSEADLRLAKNEIYARHGRIFDSEDLKDYFESKSWYKGTVNPDDFDEGVLNKYEKANIDLIRSRE